MYKCKSKSRRWHTCTSGETKSGRSLRAVENSKDGLEEDVTEDGETDAGVGLDTTEALGRADVCEVDVGAWDGEGVSTDGDVEVGELSAASEDVSALCAVVGGTGDLGVVGGDDGRRQVQESGSGVRNGVTNSRGANSGASTNRVTAGSELPESLAGGNGGVVDGTSVLGGVNVTV